MNSVVEVRARVVWEIEEERIAIDGLFAHVLVEASCGLVRDMELLSGRGLGFLLDSASGAEDKLYRNLAEREHLADSIHEVAFVVEREAVWVVDDEDEGWRVGFDLRREVDACFGAELVGWASFLDDGSDGAVELAGADTSRGLLEDVERDFEGVGDVHAFFGADDRDGRPGESFEFLADVVFVAFGGDCSSRVVGAVFGDIPLVEHDDNWFVGIDDELSELFVDLRDLGRRVEDEEDDIAPADGALGAIERIVLDLVLE